jgi:hypothetical protein
MIFVPFMQGFPAIRPELDLVEQDDQFTHEISLEDHLDPETNLSKVLLLHECSSMLH